MDSVSHLGRPPLPPGEGWGEGLLLQALNSHSPRRTHWPRLSIRPGLAILAAIGAIHQAAFGLPAFARFARCTRQPASAAVHPDLDMFSREVLRQLHAYLRTRAPRQAITAIITIETAPG